MIATAGLSRICQPTNAILQNNSEKDMLGGI